VLALVTALALLSGATRATGAVKVTVLGAAAPAVPSCPATCQAVGKMTGFQSAIGKTQSPFAAPYPGRVVAWSIKLAAPSQSQIDFFKNFYDGAPQAKISILKPVNKQIKAGHQVYKLKGESPVEDLTGFLGTTTTFTLASPLKVNTGQVVALTSPTWVPAFAVNLGADSIWRASRAAGKCMQAADIQAGTPHETIGEDRLYGCQYKTARLLYSATLVKDPNAPSTKPPVKK
jgi:hypothetical protein